MIMSEPTKEQYDAWLAIWQECSPRLKVNRRGGQEVARFLQKKYKVKEIRDTRAAAALEANILNNNWMRDKLQGGMAPDVHVFRVPDEGPGAELYENQDEVFRFHGEASDIIIMVDYTSGCYQVEGSSALWDDICCYQGLDSDDLMNFVVTGQYVECMRKAGKPV